MLDDPNVWFEAGDHLIRMEIAFEALSTFDSMRPHVSREFPVMCLAQMPGCGHAICVFAFEDDNNASAHNSWGEHDPVILVTRGGKIDKTSMPFIAAMVLDVKISRMLLDEKDVPLPAYVAGYVETAAKISCLTKEPVDVACAPTPAVKQRVKRPVKPWPRGKELPLSKRMARQVAKTASVKLHFDRKMALGLKRWTRLYTKWRPGQKSQEMKSVEELSESVSLFAQVNRPSMEAQLHRMKEQLAKRTLLREEKRARMRLSLKLAHRLPLKANEFDELPPLPAHPISDTESETDSVHTLQHECGDDELPPLPENRNSDTVSETGSGFTMQYEDEDEEQDLSNC